MSKTLKLSARPRTESGRNAVKQVRSREAIPAVIYSSKEEPANLEVNRREIERLLAHAVGEHLLIDLEIQDGGTATNRLTLIQEVQHHPVRGDILHVDFHAVSRTETIESEVPIEAVGEPDGVKNYGGVLQQLVRTLAVECLPQNLPEVVRVDISALMIGDSLHIKDIQLPDGVTAVTDSEITVFLISEPKVADPVAEVETAAAPEVLTEKKPEDDGADKK